MRGVATLVALLAVAGMATAHVPNFDTPGNDAASALKIAEPTKSWVFFDRMEPGEHWYRVDLQAGDELFVSLSAPPSQSARPVLWLAAPGQSPQKGATQLTGSSEASIEPFTPLALRQLAEHRETAQIASTYYVIVTSDAPVAYGLAVGGRESFTPLEWVRVPVDRITILAWAGVLPLAAVAGEVLATAVVVWKFRTPQVRLLIGRLGAGWIMGTAVTTLLLAMIATVQAGPSWGLVIPLVFALVAAGVGWGAWRGVHGANRWHGLWGAAALGVWAGLIVGPILLAAWALWPRGASGEETSTTGTPSDPHGR